MHIHCVGSFQQYPADAKSEDISPTVSIKLRYCSLKSGIMSSTSVPVFSTQSVNGAPLAALQTLCTGKILMNATDISECWLNEL